MSTRRDELRQDLSNAEGVRPRGARTAETMFGRCHWIYLAWFEAESECGRALRHWSECTPSDRDGTYTAYHAALDREEAAARDLERLCRSVAA